MTDLEINRLCAEAMGIDLEAEADRADARQGKWLHGYEKPLYNPLHDDAQAMALVKKMRLDILAPLEKAPRKIWVASYGVLHQTESFDLNQSICECVVKMQQAKKP